MATEATDGYRVIPMQLFTEKVRLLGERAIQSGYFQRFRETLVSVQNRLHENPAAWGEPRYRLQHLGVTVYHQILDFIHFDYAVDETNRIVWVQQLQPLSNHPLAMD
jgi:hypothetical protein